MSKPIFKSIHFSILMSTPAHIPKVAADIANAKTKKLKAKYDMCVDALKFYSSKKYDQACFLDHNNWGEICSSDARQILKECGE